jgi:hypothetical protein
VVEAVLAHQQDQGRRRTHGRLRAQTRTLALDFAFEADERGEPECDQQADDLPGSLTRAPEERRVRGQHEVRSRP